MSHLFLYLWNFTYYFIVTFMFKRAFLYSKTVLLLAVLLISTDNIMAIPKQEPVKDKGRFSMFVHWGLYSVYGGVYRGKNIEWGYSEQIQSFAGIFSDWYAGAAEQFSAKQWNADSIAVLAKRAGMDAIVFTSKHHDGFCMYNSQETDFTIMNTPFGRDALKELSQACKRHGLNLGIYFSLIDWHYPPAYPISSHNADPITPEHHEYNKRQVKELLENYGPVSELWFDMGSLTREQSSELYNLVKSIQPNCRVSGRIGNDYGDFAVMPDNVIPDFVPNKPWQTAESVYKETWGYRSWQKHVPMNEKLAEKITSLKRVIGAGGNYLLNIGPTGDGAVTNYEEELLLSIGKWIDSSEWLAAARDSLYRDNGVKNRKAVKSRDARRSDAIAVLVDKKGNRIYELKDADTLYYYSMFDYYRTKKAVCGYRWSFPYSTNSSKIRIIVPNIEKDFEAVYKNGKVVKLTHKREIEITDYDKLLLPKNIDSKQLNIHEQETISVKPQTTIIKERKFHSNENGTASFEVGTADAVEVWHNGKLIAEKMYTKEQPKPLVVAVPVVKGENNITVKLFNRFNSKIPYSFVPVETRYFEIW